MPQEQPAALAVGDPAPQIDAPITQGGRFDLAAARGTWVAIYFFPRSNTPG